MQVFFFKTQLLTNPVLTTVLKVKSLRLSDENNSNGRIILYSSLSTFNSWTKHMLANLKVIQNQIDFSNQFPFTTKHLFRLLIAIKKSHPVNFENKVVPFPMILCIKTANHLRHSNLRSHIIHAREVLYKKSAS